MKASVKCIALCILLGLFINLSSVSVQAEEVGAPPAPAVETAATTAVPPVTEDSYEDERDNYGPGIFGKTYCVINGDTSDTILCHNKLRKMYPASTTKILTALLVLENVKDLDEKMVFTPTAINVDPSSSTLIPKAQVGEELTVRQGLYGLLLASANECGAMLGEYVGGSEEHFAEMMNKKAEEIGCQNSHFVNAYGIHNDDHYTCAYDLCLIMQAAMKNPEFREIDKTVTYTIPATNKSAARTCTSTHQLINGNVQEEGIIGGKTGSTPQAGKVLVTAAERKGLYTISVLMGSDPENVYKDAQVLLEYAYNLSNQNYPPYDPVPVKDHVTVTENVRMRYSPSLVGGVYRTVEAGTVLDRKGIYQNWSLVEVNKREFYICSDYLQSDDPENVPETTKYEPTEAVPETSEEATIPVTTTAGVSKEPRPTEEKNFFEDFITSPYKIAIAVISILIIASVLVLIVRFSKKSRKRRRRKKIRRF